MKCPLCNDTLVPTKHSIGEYSHEHVNSCPFAWEDLSKAQIEVLEDAALGRVVRKMPEGSSLWRHGSAEWGFDDSHMHTVCQDALTPEAAFEAAGLMEVEK